MDVSSKVKPTVLPLAARPRQQDLAFPQTLCASVFLWQLIPIPKPGSGSNVPHVANQQTVTGIIATKRNGLPDPPGMREA